MGLWKIFRRHTRQVLLEETQVGQILQSGDLVSILSSKFITKFYLKKNARNIVNKSALTHAAIQAIMNKIRVMHIYIGILMSEFR